MSTYLDFTQIMLHSRHIKLQLQDFPEAVYYLSSFLRLFLSFMLSAICITDRMITMIFVTTLNTDNTIEKVSIFFFPSFYMLPVLYSLIFSGIIYFSKGIDIYFKQFVTGNKEKDTGSLKTAFLLDCLIPFERYWQIFLILYGYALNCDFGIAP